MFCFFFFLSLEYPWSAYLRDSLKVFLYLPSYQHSPDAMKLIGNNIYLVVSWISGLDVIVLASQAGGLGFNFPLATERVSHCGQLECV